MSLIDVDSPHVTEVSSNFEDQEVKTHTQADRLKREAENEARRAKAKAKSLKDKASSRARDGHQKIQENPVLFGNALLTVALFGGLSYGAYVKYKAGEFSWKLVGIGASVLAAFGVADFYATQ